MGANGLPLKKRTFKAIEEMKQQRKSQMNHMIGKYVENDYTFVEVHHAETTALFYHHANNKLQDDIIFVSVKIDREGLEIEHRTLITRDSLLKIAAANKDVPTKYIERGEDK